jgi:DNA-binding Lrp family transcriptional regulator
MLDALDKKIIEGLQGGFPLSERPYAQAALAFGIEEQELIARIARLLQDGVLSRFRADVQRGQNGRRILPLRRRRANR